MRMRGLTRRRFLAAGTGAAAGLAVPGIWPCRQGATQRPAASGASELFSAPAIEASRSGVLQTSLRVAEAPISIRDSTGEHIARTRCYNGHVPGPTWKLRPGDELRVYLINDLKPNTDPGCGESHPKQPHCFNTTNLHTHGLHVSPMAPSDDSLLRIEPQSGYQYCFRLPEFHPPGTFWYHAHHHGSTALQVRNGMAGALIVEEPEGQQILPDASDLVWIIQEAAGDAAEKIYTCAHLEAPCMVNGKYQPALHLRPGELQRWRFINATATPGGYAGLSLLDADGKPQQMTLIALDGYTLRRMQTTTHYVLPPGGRADFLVQLHRSVRYRMMKLRFQGNARDQVLAFVEVGGTPRKMRMPLSLPPPPPFLKPIETDEIHRHRTLRFQMCPDQARGDTCREFPDAKPCHGESPDEPIGGAFLIDGKPYDPARIDHTVRLGDAEEWEVVNETGAEHPFHIHVNHFQVVKEGVPASDWVWRDTLSLPAGGSVKIRSRFPTYPGRFLLHCHILLHSDMGMMQNVEVVGDGVGPCKAASIIR